MRRLAVLALMLMAVATPALAWQVPAEMLVAAKVRYEPLADAKVLDTLSPGDAVTILRCVPSGAWCKVRHPGRDGWVPAVSFDRLADLHRKFCRDDSDALLCRLH